MTTTYQITPYFFNSSNLRSATEYPLLISFMLPIVVALVTCQNRPPVAFISQNSCLCVFVFQPAVIFDNNLSLLSIEKPHCFVVYFSWLSILSLLSSGDTLFLLCLFKCTHKYIYDSGYIFQHLRQDKEIPPHQVALLSLVQDKLHNKPYIHNNSPCFHITQAVLYCKQ